MSTFMSGNIELLNGWNYISFPKALNPYYGHNLAGYVFDGVNTGGRSIYYYDSSLGYWVSLTASTVIRPLVGYTIYSVGSYTLNPDYLPANQQTNPSVSLYSGWNLIGYFDPMGNYADDYLHAAMARDEMAPLGADWDELIGWDADTQDYETSILRGYDDIHSEYRLVYPTKGYWLWMNSDRNLAYSVSHTYYCSAEYVVDYPPSNPDRDCEPCDNIAIGFYDNLKTSSQWSGNNPGFLLGNGNANKNHWKDVQYGGQDHDYIDKTHFALFSGHGGSGGIEFSNGITSSYLTYDEALWGNTKVDWIALAACDVLNQSGIDNWKPRFKGLHSIVGWATLGLAHDDFGWRFSNYMKGPYSIWGSWKKAANDCVWEQNKYKVAILAVDIDKNPNTAECVDDHIYGKGSWMSPPGYDLEFYFESVYCV